MLPWRQTLNIRALTRHATWYARLRSSSGRLRYINSRMHLHTPAFLHATELLTRWRRIAVPVLPSLCYTPHLPWNATAPPSWHPRGMELAECPWCAQPPEACTGLAISIIFIIKLAPKSGFEMYFAIGSQHLWCRGSQPKHVSIRPRL